MIDCNECSAYLSAAIRKLLAPVNQEQIQIVQGSGSVGLYPIDSLICRLQRPRGSGEGFLNIPRHRRQNSIDMV